MKYISLFAGIGGFDLALNRLGHEAVYVNEWDKYAAAIYEKNFDHKPDTRDIRNVQVDELPEFDLLCGGFPCQTFSIAGRRRGFDDTRGTLFHEIARLAASKRPTYLLLENVKGLLSHDNNRTFQTILRTFDELGYNLQWQILNSKNFGVPQSRERVFIVGNLRGKPRPQIFPFTNNGELLDESDNSKGRSTQTPVSTTVRVGMQTKADSTYIIPKVSHAIDANYYKGINSGSQGGISSLDKGKRQVIIQDVRAVKKSQNGKGYKDDLSESYTVDTLSTQGILNKTTIRRLTPLECERLQGFPEGWTEGISDTQRYKCLGNAVTVNVVHEVAKYLPLHL